MPCLFLSQLLKSDLLLLVHVCEYIYIFSKSLAIGVSKIG